MFSTIRGYATSSFYNVTKIIYTAGQSYFGLRTVAKYASDNPIVHQALPAIGIVGSVGVNIIRSYTTYKRFNPSLAVNKHADLLEPNPEPLDKMGYFLYGLMTAANGITGCLNTINAYFGTVVLCEELGKLAHSDVHDATWKEALIQTAAILSVISSIATYYAYEGTLNQRNARKLAANWRNWQAIRDKNVIKTLAVSSLNLIITPVLINYWTEPAIRKIPKASVFLKDVGVNILVKIMSGASFVTTVMGLPSMYAAFNHSEQFELPNKKSAKSLQIAMYLFGTIDALSNGLCTMVGIVETAKAEFKVDDHGYILIFAVPSGLSNAAQTLFFSFRPAAIELLRDKYGEKSAELEPFLPEHNNDSSDSEEDASTASTLKKEVVQSIENSAPIVSEGGVPKSNKDEITIDISGYQSKYSQVGLFKTASNPFPETAPNEIMDELSHVTNNPNGQNYQR